MKREGKSEREKIKREKKREREGGGGKNRVYNKKICVLQNKIKGGREEKILFNSHLFTRFVYTLNMKSFFLFSLGKSTWQWPDNYIA